MGNKILSKKELIEEIIDMKRGDVYTFEALKDNSPMWNTLITKTRWFDSHVVIIGGAGDELFVSKDFCNDENIEESITNLINDFVESVFSNKPNQFTLSNKSKLTIESNTPSLGCGNVDNFEYV